jgi:hypothetical protein
MILIPTWPSRATLADAFVSVNLTYVKSLSRSDDQPVREPVQGYCPRRDPQNRRTPSKPATIAAGRLPHNRQRQKSFARTVFRNLGSQSHFAQVNTVFEQGYLRLKRLGNPVGEVWLIHDCPRMRIAFPWWPESLPACNDQLGLRVAECS